jgi:hypothetical protein
MVILDASMLPEIVPTARPQMHLMSPTNRELSGSAGARVTVRVALWQKTSGGWELSRSTWIFCSVPDWASADSGEFCQINLVCIFCLGRPIKWAKSRRRAQEYPISTNVKRRHLNKGQQAMATAMIYPGTEQGKKSASLRIKEVNGGYLSQARIVRKWAPELAQAVLAGAQSL